MAAPSLIERLALWWKPQYYELFSGDASLEKETFFSYDAAFEQALKQSDTGKKVALYSVHGLPGLGAYFTVKKLLLRTEETMRPPFSGKVASVDEMIAMAKITAAEDTEDGVTAEDVRSQEVLFLRRNRYF